MIDQMIIGNNAFPYFTIRETNKNNIENCKVCVGHKAMNASNKQNQGVV